MGKIYKLRYRSRDLSYRYNCAYCSEMLYGGEIIPHLRSCSERFNWPLNTSQAKCESFLYIIGIIDKINPHINQWFDDEIFTQFLLTVYSFLYKLRVHGRQTAFSQFTGKLSRVFEIMLTQIYEEIRPKVIPIFPHFVEKINETFHSTYWANQTPLKFVNRYYIQTQNEKMSDNCNYWDDETFYN